MYQIPTVENILATRHEKDAQPLEHVEYLVKWVGRTLADNTWEPISNLGYNASFLIQNFDAETNGQQVWKTILVTADRRTIIINFTTSAKIGIAFRITGDQAYRGKRFVYSIDDGSPAMILSKGKLQVGAILMSVNDDSSYNTDQIGTVCKARPLKLEFSQSAYPVFGELLQKTLGADRDISAVFSQDDIRQARKRVFSPQGDLFSMIMQHIIAAQQNTDYHNDMGNSMAAHTYSDITKNPMANGVYLTSLGISLAHWLVGLECESCLGLFNHYGVFTIAQLFCMDISYSGLAVHFFAVF